MRGHAWWCMVMQGQAWEGRCYEAGPGGVGCFEGGGGGVVVSLHLKATRMWACCGRGTGLGLREAQLRPDRGLGGSNPANLAQMGGPLSPLSQGCT